MKTPFFSKKEIESKLIYKGKSLTCASCGLYRFAESPKMEEYGNFKKGILNIGDFPEDLDDEKGKPFQDKTGRFLQKVYKEIGIDLFDDCLNINAINCYSDKNPTDYQVQCCNTVKVDKVIEKYNPNIIVLFGNMALQSIIGNRWKKNLRGISTWRGFTIPDRDYNCWIIPTYSPNFILKNDKKEAYTIWKQDLQKVVEKVGQPLPRNPKPNIKIIKDLKPLEKLSEYSNTTIAFDYETTGLKPHAKGHRIVCCSVAYSPDDVYSFIMPDTKYDRQPLLKLLTSLNVGKRAHNIKFEHNWTKERLKVEIKNWEWDSMLAAHLLDNRSYITSLKFQAYVNLGIVDYASEVEPYLRMSDYKNANSLNTINELIATKRGKDDLLHYCALDSLYEYRLSQIQIETIDYDYLPF